MTKKQLEVIATHFRQAIVDAKKEGAFDHRDRMSRFPHGCCDDTADLFAHYLFCEYGLVSNRVNGVYYDGNPENSCSHSWLELDGMVIDLTGSQFKYDPVFLNYDYDVYVGRMDKFHELFEIEYKQQSRGIKGLGDSCQNRMYVLYETIVQYLAGQSVNEAAL